MKVLYIHQYFSVLEGSTGNRSYWFSKKLAARGHTVVVVCGDSHGAVSGLLGSYRLGFRAGKVEDFWVVQIRVRYANALGKLGRFIAFVGFSLLSSFYVLTSRFDLLFASSTPLTVAFPAIVAKKLRRKKTIFEVRDLWPSLLVEMGAISNASAINLLLALERMAYRISDHVVTLAPGILERVQEVRGGAPGTSMISNGSDLGLFEVARDTRLQRGAFEGNRISAIYAGAHGKANGLDFLIEVAKELDLRAKGAVNIVLVGEGSEKASLRERTETFGLKSIEFRGPVEKKLLPSLFAEFDVGLQILAPLKGFHEGTSPNKFFDYIAAGLPVFTNYPGWIANLLSASGCGHVAVTPKEFAKKLEEFSLSGIERQKMGESAILLATNSFNREKLADELVNLVERVGGGTIRN